MLDSFNITNNQFNIVENSKHPRFMIVPSLHCPGSCVYCFGPNRGSVMEVDIMRKTLDFIERVCNEA